MALWLPDPPLSRAGLFLFKVWTVNFNKTGVGGGFIKGMIYTPVIRVSQRGEKGGGGVR